MGVEKEILRPGNGPKPRPGQSVTVHCTGYGKNEDLSQKFWSTKDPGQKPFTFTIGQGNVIKGWDEGVLDMQLGEIARLRCSPDYGYGPNGFAAWGYHGKGILSGHTVRVVGCIKEPPDAAIGVDCVEETKFSARHL